MADLRIGLLVLLACAWASAQLNNDVFVNIPELGVVKGTTLWKSQWLKRPINAFRGIPFGQAPVGPLRFKPPLPYGPWKGLLNGVQFGTICEQTGNFKNERQPMGFWDHIYSLGENVTSDDPESRFGKGEDCLNLQVYTPNVDMGAKKMPVMVFFHGGAFLDGSSKIYWTHYFMDHDVVIVVPHYRLGPIGFLSMQNDEIPGNAGIFDQLLALEWVRDHIGAFNGDPDQVTIFGESAGAASVSLISTSPLGKGLFNRIIAQSGSAITEWAIDRDPVFNALGVAEAAGCDVTLTEQEIVDCLRSVNSRQLVEAYKYIWKPSEQRNGRTGFGGCSPVVQTNTGTKVLLDKMPIDYWRDPTFESVPGMYGANKHEGTYVMAIVYDGYMRANDLLFDHDFIKYQSVRVFLDLFLINDPSYVLHDSLEYEYIGIENMGNLTAMIPGMIDFSGATFLKAPSFEQTKMHAKFGKSYWYAFNYATTATLWPFVGSFNVPFDGGVTHANELMFLFAIPAVTDIFTPEDGQIAKKMTMLWYNYAAYGETTPAENPVEGVPDWPHYDPVTDHYMRFDAEFQVLTNFPDEYTIARDENFPVKPVIP